MISASSRGDVKRCPVFSKSVKMRTTALFQFLLAALATVALMACDKDDTDVPQFDSVIIGSQEWMTKSLDVDTFRNGDPIPEANSYEEWGAANLERRPAWCYYLEDPHNGELYGRLYNYYAVIDPRGLAPEGWHVSTQSEWKEMFDHLGSDAADKLKSRQLWVEDGGGNNSSGFSALPGSGRWRGGNFVDNPFYRLGHAVLFWTSSGTYYLLSAFGIWGYGWSNDQEGGVGAYVRCVRGTDEELSISIGDQFWKARNLDVITFRNGAPIPYAPTMAEWAAAADQHQPAWCYYLDDPENGRQYGLLYNWYAVTDPRGLAPKGYHIPDASEWMVLEAYLAENGLDGGALKSVTGWHVNTMWATNYTSFSALPGQMRFDNGAYYEGAQLALFWSTDSISEANATARGVHGDVNNFSTFFHAKGAGLSVRCLRE